jgi:hypothetical protein
MPGCALSKLSLRMGANMTRIQTSWDRFEISILRLCRGQYLALAVLGAVAILGGSGTTIVGCAMGTPTRLAPPPEVPPQPPLALSAVEQLRASRPSLFDLTKATSTSLTADPQKPQLDVAKSIKDVFPDPPYAWDDVTQEYCRVPSGYGCLEKGRKIAKPGTARLIAFIIGDMSRTDAAALLEGIRPVLSAAKVEQRAELILPSGIAYLDAVKKHQQAIDEWQKKIDEVNAKYDLDAEARRVLKAGLVAGGLYGVGSGMSAMLLSGLFLAFLAMERHLRDLRERPPST